MAKKDVVTVEDIQVMDIKDLTPYEDNPRLNDDAVDGVAMSIEHFGFTVPIVVDEFGVIITGHTRRKAALKLGMKSVPVIVAKHLSEQQVRAFRLADNKVAEAAKWDDVALSREMELLQANGFDLDMTGFSKEEIDCLTTVVDASCLDDLNQDDICGQLEDAKANIVANKRVSVSVGSYKLFVTKEEFQRWEKANLAEHGSKADIVRNLAKVLGLREAEFDDKT